MVADVYVLANDRKAENIMFALEKYLPDKVYQIGNQIDKFEYFDEAKDVGKQPTRLFDKEMELFEFLENQDGILFRPSFRSLKKSDIRVITFYYFQDNSLVFGVNMHQDVEKEDFVLNELKKILESNYGYISYHIPPEYGKANFIELCQKMND